MKELKNKTKELEDKKKKWYAFFLTILLGYTVIIIVFLFTSGKEIINIISRYSQYFSFFLALIFMIYYFVLLFKIKKKHDSLKEELEIYKSKIDDYKEKIEKEKEVKEGLAKDLEKTKDKLNNALQSLNLKEETSQKIKIALEEYEKKVDDIEETKTLYERYINWNEEIKKLFDMFLINSTVYVDEKGNYISLRTGIERDTSNISKPYRTSMSIMKDQVKDQIKFLIKQEIITLKDDTKRDDFDYKLILTRKGVKLRNSLVHIGTDELRSSEK